MYQHNVDFIHIGAGHDTTRTQKKLKDFSQNKSHVHLNGKDS